MKWPRRSRGGWPASSCATVKAGGLCTGGAEKFQADPHWRDYILFHEYFHGDNGAGLGASHQTGWTGIIARLMHLFATSTAEQFLELGKFAGFTEIVEQPRRGQSGEASIRSNKR